MPKNDVAVELFYDGAWHDLVPADDVFADTPIVIQRGDGDESAAPRPSSITLRLANDDDMYRTTNPESPLYGKAGVNTPLRVLVGGVSRGQVEVSSWRAGQTRDFRANPRRGKAWVDIEGGGLLQRVGQWTEPLKSPFRRYNEPLTHVIGYWPLEQDRGSTTLFSPTPGTKQIIMQNVAFDSQFRPPGSSPVMDIGDDPSEAGAYFAATSASVSAGWQLSWAARLGPLVAGEQDIFDWETTDGTAYGLYLDSTLGQILVYSSLNGTPVLNGVGDTYGGYDWSQWTLFSLDAQYVAGSTNLYINWTNGDNTDGGFVAVGFGDVPSHLRWWDASAFAGVPPGSTIGHVMGADVSSTGGVDLFSAARIAAWTGHLNETTGNRFVRLMTELGLSYATNGDLDASSAMGPQPADTLANLLKEIRDTEDAVLFESKAAINLILTCRGFRYNLDPALTLNAADADGSGLPNLPAEVSDDLPIHNLVTASQRDGSEYTVEDSTSPMGTQPPPDGRGEYRQTVDVSVADEADLEQVAYWRLYRGTVNLPRFPQVAVNLAALDAAKIAEVESVTVGSVIEIVNYREYTIRLYVIGYTETIGTHSRMIVFACAPDQQFAVGEYDDGVVRYDSGSTTTGAAYPFSETSIVFSTTNAGDVWSTVDEPYDCVCAGERFTVTSMGAVSGTGPYLQTATVTRAVNGVRKTLPAGEEIHVAAPGRYAL
jgi:hypothetical protein